ncbi:MAG: hypothetical protein RMK99_14670 [Anaerolineales bacterium]|nr:hypothetical protein [Anaerolineales bacterium]
MSKHALFEGLVVDEDGNPVTTTVVGGEAQYVVWDAGFKFHVDAETIDRQVLRLLGEQIAEHKSQVAEGVMRMLGKDDLFTKAAIDYSLNHLDQSFDQIIASGLPESARAYLGMLGFRIVVNYHGELVRVEQPGIVSDEGE